MTDVNNRAKQYEMASVEVERARQVQEVQARSNEELAQKLAQDALMLGGQAQAHDFHAKVANLGRLAALKRVKESKGYKNIGDGTWAAYCRRLGFTARKIDEDLKNLEVFGEEFLASAHRLGLGYRDLAQLRALPEDARLQITDGKVVNLEKASRGEIRALIEDMAIRHAAERKRLEDQVTEAERGRKRAEEKAEAEAQRTEKLRKKLEQAEAGLGDDEAAALKKLAGFKREIAGICNLIGATDPGWTPRVKSEALALLAFAEDLSRLTAIRLSHEFGDGTSPAEVEAAEEEFSRHWPEDDEGQV